MTAPNNLSAREREELHHRACKEAPLGSIYAVPKPFVQYRKVYESQWIPLVSDRGFQPVRVPYWHEGGEDCFPVV